jgi:hypothetical protein
MGELLDFVDAPLDIAEDADADEKKNTEEKDSDIVVGAVVVEMDSVSMVAVGSDYVVAVAEVGSADVGSDVGGAAVADP